MTDGNADADPMFGVARDDFNRYLGIASRCRDALGPRAEAPDCTCGLRAERMLFQRALQLVTPAHRTASYYYSTHSYHIYMSR